MKKYEKEYLLKKEQEAQLEDPVERLQVKLGLSCFNVCVLHVSSMFAVVLFGFNKLKLPVVVLYWSLIVPWLNPYSEGFAESARQFSVS